MADYCTIDEVSYWLPRGQTLDDQTDSEPTRATVVLWIPKYTAIIDAALSRQGETTPLTGNRATEVGVIVAREIAYQVMVVRGQKGDVSDGDWEGLKWHTEFQTLVGDTPGAATDTVVPWGFPDSTTTPAFTRAKAREW